MDFFNLRAAEANTTSLSGQWRFAIDREDKGITEQWFNKNLAERIRLPGSLQEQGFGDDVSVETKWTGDIIDKSWFTDPRYAPYRQPGNVKVPFWLQPTKHYVGAAWYQRDVDIPQQWHGRRIVLHLERPHWETTVWLDDQRIGSNNSLAVPHEYDLSSAASPGKHRLTVRVDNRYLIEVGVNAHSVSDHTQGNWNGIAGRLQLAASAPVWIDDVQVFPDAASKKLRVRVAWMNPSGTSVDAKLSLGVETGPASAKGADWTRELHRQQGEIVLNQSKGSGSSTARSRVLPQTITVSQNYQTTSTNITADMELALGEAAQPWDEFTPRLYRLRAELRGTAAGRSFAHEKIVTFGLRDVGVSGKQITVNERKIFLRGTLECAIFPLHGYPPTDVASWKRLLGVARGHGLNHLRFHSWCPPEAAFAAADELGFYFYVECPAWANQGSSVGDGRKVDAWLNQEGDRILRTYGNHPSFIMMSYGNEPAGKNQNRFLADLIHHWKSKDARRLYTSGAGWPTIPESDFHVTHAARAYPTRAKLGETSGDYGAFLAKQTAPIVSHEIGQYCVFPNLDEIPKYTGWLRPKNFEIVSDFLRDHGMRDQAREFLRASGKLQALFYKDEIEACLRTKNWAGFELLDLHDFPGQGTALVGVLDPFWGEKGYIKPEEFRRFCDETVPLARLPKRVFTDDEEFHASVEVAHFGREDWRDAEARWRIRDGTAKVVASGNFAKKSLPTGVVTPLGEVRLRLGPTLQAKTAIPLTPALSLREREPSVVAREPSPDREKNSDAGLPLPLPKGEGRGEGNVSLKPNKDGITTDVQAAALNLEVAVLGTKFVNDWNFWVYPAGQRADPPGVMVSRQLDNTALAALRSGGRVVLFADPRSVRGNTAGHFDPIFWNKLWFPKQRQHTLGILVNPKHPALSAFPTAFHSDWQWQDLQNNSKPMVLDELPKEFLPIVQVIDDWNTCRKLGLVFEAQAEKGRLLVCTIDLERDLERRPAARQLRRSLLAYAAGDRFRPKEHVELSQVRSLFNENGFAKP